MTRSASDRAITGITLKEFKFPFLGGVVFGALIAGVTLSILNFFEPVPPLPPINLLDARSVLEKLKAHGFPESWMAIHEDGKITLWLKQNKYDDSLTGGGDSIAAALADLHSQGVLTVEATQP